LLFVKITKIDICIAVVQLPLQILVFVDGALTGVYNL